MPNEVKISRTKTIIHKVQYKIDKDNQFPQLTIEYLADLLANNPRGVPNVLDYEIKQHDVHFKISAEDTHLDFTLHYADKIYKFSTPENTNSIPQIIGYEYKDRVTKVDYVSFFTKHKENMTEHRIYQIGRRYGTDEFTVEDLFRLGELNYDIENFDKSILHYEKALIIKPDNFIILGNLGLASICKGDYVKAISSYKKALGINAEDPIIWDNLGIAYEYNEEFIKAKEAYLKAYELDPEDEEIKTHLKQLDSKS